MKVIILSGAGLSVPSGLPTYEVIQESPEYQAFQTSDVGELKEHIEKACQKYSTYKENKAHLECMFLETYCKSLGVDFQHYTLNIDCLIEKAGGSAIHIHGCLSEPESIIEYKDVPCVDLFALDWNPNDLLIVLGVSNSGFPLAAIEAKALAAGARFINYNIESNVETVTDTTLGDLAETFRFLDHKNLPAIEFIEVDLEFIVDQLKCNIEGNEYVIYLTPSTECDFSDERLEETEALVGMTLGENCYEIKFDLQSNIDNETWFEPPQKTVTRRQLNLLGRVIAALILSHSASRKGIVYTASAVDERLVSFYNMLAKRYADQLNYTAWCSFGTERINYAFKKK
ncbi:SIR2 family NAD-dependent protein deacylase [Vibrio sp. S12_S33]|uniref:SIR2 family NAD-dependent protein deacylase n=1 Tax=Vibrio sp. S12_S33 TaxID=2720223 RepID=UPI001785E885|nr:hypothetical protein [Vibrio sp. S12_S33]MBD1566921.1 hypothetical protein [Vibrio sp. S12_S33]